MRACGALLLLAGFGTALVGVAFAEAHEDVPAFFLFPVATLLAVAGGIVFTAVERLRGHRPTPAVAQFNDGLVLLGIGAGFGALGCAGVVGWVAGANGAWCRTFDDVCGGSAALFAGIASLAAMVLAAVGTRMRDRGRSELDRRPGGKDRQRPVR
jgi:hypothetical protein